MINITETEWRAFLVNSQPLAKVEALFERIDPDRIEEERERLIRQLVK